MGTSESGSPEMNSAAEAKSGVAGERAVMTPPKRRSFMSREMCEDLVAALTVLIVTGAGFAATPLADFGVERDGFNLSQSDPVFLVCTGFFSALAFAEALRLGDYFRFDQLLETWGSIRGIAWRWAVTMLSLIALFFAFGMSDSLPRSWLVGWSVFAVLGLIIGRFVTAHILKKLIYNGRSLNRKILVVGMNPTADLFVQRASAADSGLSVIGQLSAEETATSGQGVIGRAQALVEEGRLDDVVICLPNEPEDRMSKIVHRLSALPIHVALCPDHMWLERGAGHVSTIGAMPLLTVHRRPLAGWSSFWKLLEDKIIGGLIFLAALPVMLVCALAVRLEGPGPIFFIQNRQGFAGDIFPIVKFRTMRVMENGDNVKQATKDDDRITRVGRILRKYSLDELPQFWNVLRGDMSLVGPRPHAIAHDKYYMTVIADYAFRHKVKPGITGWAQIKGYRGETTEDEAMAARIKHDLEYIENWSLWFDLRIIFMTVFAVLLPKNAY